MSSWQNLLSLVLSKLNNNNWMAATPFFSSRIPPELHARLDQHIAETGESKTQVLINALEVYLNQISNSNLTLINNTSPNLLNEKIKSLEDRLATLELSFMTQNYSAANDKIITGSGNNRLLPEKILCESNEIVLDNLDNIEQDNDNSNAISQDNSEDTLSSQEESIKLNEGIPKLEILTTIELCKKSGLTRSQLDNHKKKVIKKYEEVGKSLEDKKMLDFPEKIEPRSPIIIEGYPYDLFYWGQNEKGNNLWTAVPYDNERYEKFQVETRNNN